MTNKDTGGPAFPKSGNESLGEALPREQTRVRKLIVQYRDSMLNGAGVFAAHMMELDLQRADHAVMSGDVVAMIQAYESLKGWE